MEAKRPRGAYLTLLLVSIACSLVSLAVLVIHPQNTSSWRTSLNIIAVLLVIMSATKLRRGSTGPDA